MRSSCTIFTRLDHRTRYPRTCPTLSFFFPFFSFLFPISFYARRRQPGTDRWALKRVGQGRGIRRSAATRATPGYVVIGHSGFGRAAEDQGVDEVWFCGGGAGAEREGSTTGPKGTSYVVIARPHCGQISAHFPPT